MKQDNYYRNRKIITIIRILIFVIAIGLQIYGHKMESYLGLGIQFLSLALLIFLLYAYRKQLDRM